MRTLFSFVLFLCLLGSAQAQSSLSSSAAGTVWGNETNAPLPEGMAFRTEAQREDGWAIVTISPAPGYYVYRRSLSVSSTEVSLGAMQVNGGEIHDDPQFGRVEIYRAPFQIRVFTDASQTFSMKVHFQGCQQAGVCYAPMARTLTVNGGPATNGPTANAPAVSAATGNSTSSHGDTGTVKTTLPSSHPERSEDERLASLLAYRSPWQALAIFAGLGLLLGFTPCVLPMVPILLGLVAGQPRPSSGKALKLAGAYVLANASVFAGMGVLAAWAGAGLQGAFQSAWTLVPMALLLTALGLALVLGVSIQMPQRVQQWAGGKGNGGRVAGAAAMGALSSLMVGPCVAPPLAGAVLFLAQEGNPWLGASALFVLGAGMGLPLILAAGGLGQWLPRAGSWSVWLTRALGVGLLVMAGWLAHRVLPLSGLLEGIALLGLVGTGVWVLKGRTHRPTHGSHRTGMAVAVGFLALLGGGMTMSFDRQPPDVGAKLFSTVTTTKDLERVLTGAARDKKTVVLDFYADWCTACLSMERKTFSDARVQRQLKQGDIIPIKVDVTQNTDSDQALMKRYSIVGPPATLFFQNEQEDRASRLVGYEESAAFLRRLNVVQAPCEKPSPSTPPSRSPVAHTC